MKRTNQKNDVVSFIIDQSESYKKFKSLAVHFSNFTKSKKTSFEQIDYDFLSDFKHYLTLRLKPSTVRTQLSYLRSVFNKAIKAGITRHYPFCEFKVLRYDEERRIFFSKHQLGKLEKTQVPFNLIIRHAFFFIYYTGITVLQLKSLTIIQTRQMMLKGKAAELWDLIVNSRINEDELLFDDFPDNTTAANALRLWGALAGLKERPAFSAARNTFIMNELKKGKSIRQICIQLGIKKPFSMRVYKRMFDDLYCKTMTNTSL